MARKAGVDLEAVVDTAAAIADQQGLAAATLASVAERLGIRPPSLYAHVAGLAGLRRHLTLRAGRDLAHTLETAAAGDHGAAALHAVAAAYRSWARTHPGLYAVLLPAPRPGVDPELDAALHLPVAAVARPLTELGATPSDVVPLVRTLRATLHGFVTLEQAGGFALPDDIDASFHIAVDIVITGITDRTSTKPPAARPYTTA